VLMIFFINVWVDMEDHPTEYGNNDAYVECEELSWDDSVAMNITNGRSWMEYLNNTGFCSEYNVSYQDVTDAGLLRTNLYVAEWTEESDYWQQVYYQLYADSKDRLQSLQDSLLTIKEQMNLDRDAFATMVVAFVQDIPYEYVLPEECTGAEISPCNGNVAFGLYSPVEFLGRMHGDCDTRTVLLYTLLKNFGYDPLIINSHEYLHSMLALDVASSGDDFEYKGKRYAYWETTNVGWLAGMLPPDMNNKDYWSVALDYEFENNFAGGH
jgi:hypothetical protein